MQYFASTLRPTSHTNYAFCIGKMLIADCRWLCFDPCQGHNSMSRRRPELSPIKEIPFKQRQYVSDHTTEYLLSKIDTNTVISRFRSYLSVYRKSSLSSTFIRVLMKWYSTIIDFYEHHFSHFIYISSHFIKLYWISVLWHVPLEKYHHQHPKT